MLVKSRFPVYIRIMAMVMLFAMFHYVVGYRLLYSLGIIYTKEEAKECIVKKNNLKKFTLSASDFTSVKWTEANKEFCINGQMYDLVNIQKLGDKYCIMAYADNPETELIAALHHFETELFHPEQPNKNSKSAEDVMSAFQKDCTTASGFKIKIFALIRSLEPVSSVEQLPMLVPNIIWHPPATC